MMEEAEFKFLLLYIIAGVVILFVTVKTVAAIWDTASDQKKIVKLLEAIYKQNGGSLDDLLPEAYRDKRKEPSE